MHSKLRNNFRFEEAYVEAYSFYTWKCTTIFCFWSDEKSNPDKAQRNCTIGCVFGEIGDQRFAHLFVNLAVGGLWFEEVGISDWRKIDKCVL